MLLDIANLSSQVTLPSGDILTTVDNVSLTLTRGKSYSIVGKSGSGKTSLISIIGMLNARFTGSYLYKDTDVTTLSDRERAKLRAERIGFVFQNYSLIKHLSVWENVALPLKYANKHISKKKLREAAYTVLSEVGLSDKTKAMPTHLSGGEQQRVAIARALVANPEFIICDEPTGALDTATGEAVMALLHNLVHEHQATMLLVTHDKDIAGLCDENFVMDRGSLAHA